MILHFFDARTEVSVREWGMKEVLPIPRVGDQVCLAYGDKKEGASGMWVVVDVTWNHWNKDDPRDLVVDIGLKPYEEGDWVGTADEQLKADGVYGLRVGKVSEQRGG